MDEKNRNKLEELWKLVNNETNLIKTNANNLVIGDIYVVMYQSEKYRGKLLESAHGLKVDYKVMYYCLSNVYYNKC